jgi:hypothetical protein
MQVVLEHPNMSGTNLITEIEARWKRLSWENKARYGVKPSPQQQQQEPSAFGMQQQQQQQLFAPLSAYNVPARSQDAQQVWGQFSANYQQPQQQQVPVAPTMSSAASMHSVSGARSPIAKLLLVIAHASQRALISQSQVCLFVRLLKCVCFL